MAERSHALLLSRKGFTIKQLSGILDVRKETILDWYNRSGKFGLSGLADHSKSSRPNFFDPTTEKNLPTAKRHLS